MTESKMVYVAAKDEREALAITQSNGGRNLEAGQGDRRGADEEWDPEPDVQRVYDGLPGGEVEVSRPLSFEWMPILPEFAEVFRANGECRCEICGDLYRRHERYAYPSLLGSVVKGCDGRFYHL